jgi:hypothetical protein
MPERAVAVGLLAMLAVAGCSSSGPKNVSRFVGTWTYSSGNFDATCPGGLVPPISNTLAGQTVTLMAGTSSDLVAVQQTTYGACSVQLSVDGTMASATPNQTCTLNVAFAGTTVPVTLTVTSWTLTTSADGSMLTNAAAGTASSTGGLISNCAVTLSGTASKSGGGTDASAG